MQVTVIGIGQTIRGDDGAGIAAVRRWQQSFSRTAQRPDVRIQYVELPGLNLLDLLEGSDGAVLVDAVEDLSDPGTIHRLGPNDLASFTSGSQSAHGWGVAETLALARQVQPNLGLIPIRLVGITAAQMQLGAAMSEAVERALQAACVAIEAEVRALLSATEAPRRPSPE